MIRAEQGLAHFDAVSISSGYYTDLTGKASKFASPANARAWLGSALADRASVNPVEVVQLGLGAWQLGLRDDAWNDVAREVSAWIVADAEDNDGVLWYRFRMPHTYDLRAPWASGMAQGEALSLLHRTGIDSASEAARAIAAVVVNARHGLVADTAEGPAVQEYPTATPSHVLNGWVFALWGLRDHFESTGESGAMFVATKRALERRLHLYELAGGWTRYDLYPSRLVNVASPFYQALHAHQMAACARLFGDQTYEHAAERWNAARRNVPLRAAMTARKAAFRVLRPTFGDSR